VVKGKGYETYGFLIEGIGDVNVYGGQICWTIDLFAEAAKVLHLNIIW
jgi:hypothetical protein